MYKCTTSVYAPPTCWMALASGSYQLSASFSSPASFGWTPSPVSVVESKPVKQSTTVMLLLAVESVGAHSAIAALRSSTPWPQVVQPSGLMGIICATFKSSISGQWTREALVQGYEGNGLKAAYKYSHRRVVLPHLIHHSGKGLNDHLGPEIIPHIVRSEMHHDYIWLGALKPRRKLILGDNLGG